MPGRPTGRARWRCSIAKERIEPASSERRNLRMVAGRALVQRCGERSLPRSLVVSRERGRDGRGADDRARRRASHVAGGPRSRASQPRSSGSSRWSPRWARADARADRRAAARRRGAVARLRAAVAAEGDPAGERLQGAPRRGRHLRAASSRTRPEPRASAPASTGTAFTLSFKGVFLEGLEVAFIVLTFGATQGNIPLAAVGAAARGRARHGRRARRALAPCPGAGERDEVRASA